MSWNLDLWILEVPLLNKPTYAWTYRSNIGQGPNPLPENDGMRIPVETRVRNAGWFWFIVFVASGFVCIYIL